jgi:hypothetical protein
VKAGQTLALVALIVAGMAFGLFVLVHHLIEPVVAGFTR